VQQEDPADAINTQRLAEVENDRDVHNTLEKSHLPTTITVTAVDEDDEDLLADAPIRSLRKPKCYSH
jgi:hypothetical protein